MGVSLVSVTSDWTIQHLADFNGDGKADILWRHTSGFVGLWFMDGPSAIGSGPVATVPPDWAIQ